MPQRGKIVQNAYKMGYSLSENDFGVIGFVRKCELLFYFKQILGTG